ncbi:MAG: GGDEF domain-containing protein [Oscillospiraceae bacterium]|nr:GGDEF domain-containing protein [Oscillospiraceae bacterium]
MLDFTYIYILTAVALVVLITVIRRSSYFDDRKNKYYMYAVFADIFILLGYVGRDWSEQLGNVTFAYISNTVIYLCAPLSMLLLVLAATKKADKVICILSVLEAISILIALSSPFTKLFFEISQDAVYSRGPLYIYNEVLGILFTICWAVYSFMEFKYIELIDKLCLLEIFILQVGAIILQGFNSTYKIIYICGAFMILVYYAFVIEVYGKYDKLTGVRNNLYYRSIIKNRAPQNGYSVIMFDANGLKKVNDTFGHEAGDNLICGVASAITKAVGKKGAVYRIGGDEFVAIINSNDLKVVENINNTVHKELAERDHEYEFTMSASSGIALHSGGKTFADMVKCADKMMYENKNQYYISNGLDRRRY